MEINLLLSYSSIHKKSYFVQKNRTWCRKGKILEVGCRQKKKNKADDRYKNLMMGGFDYVKNYGLRFFISNDIWNIKNKFGQQYSVVPNEQQFCTETIKSSRD